MLGSGHKQNFQGSRYNEWHYGIGGVVMQRKALLALLATTLLLPWAISPGQQESLPQPMVQLPCRILSVHDGDTLTVEVVTVVNVRLLDCWAPELSQAGGTAARDNLKELAKVGTKGVITVPLHDNFSKSWTFGRLLGSVSVEGGGDLAKAQRGAGHATLKK